MTWACSLHRVKQLRIQGLLNRLSDANEEMSGLLSGGGDSRSHTLARHRDILHDFMQVSPSP